MGGGTVDYATIPAASLPANDYYHLSEKPLPFSINCGSTATQVSLSIADSQSNSTVPGILGPGFPESQNFGLGMVGTKRTGGYSVRFMNLTATGSSLYPLKRVSQSAGWLYNSDGRIDKTPYQHSWSRSTAPTPALVSSVSGTLIVKAVINKANDLNLSQDVPLNGLATLVVARI
ncbi:DUF1120 domain-containing protein [Pseudomonas azotoformans]|uniref:DUF1120 domain-containing protein n=1 Tax=Pseudomonas azotoformans TaxID=47878 RepID=UPI00146CE1EA